MGVVYDIYDFFIEKKVIVSDSESSPSHHENVERNKGKTKNVTKPSGMCTV